MLDLLILAQDAPPPPEAGPRLWAVLLDNAFPLTILFIFLAAIVSVVLKVRRKDKCLKLLSGYHVGYLTTAGKALWGDLIVYSSGIELEFDAPYTTRRGLHKRSALIYDSELANCLAICRTEDSLTEQEKAQRRAQVRRSYAPGLIRRSIRGFRNFVNTLRDAFSKALTALIGQFAKARPGSTIASQQGQVNEIGQTLLGAAGNAYEPMLEAHIGRPVILKLASPTEPTQQPLELPGYLVDYTEKYVAVFNVEHQPIEPIKLTLDASHEQPGLKVELLPEDVVITCTGPEVIVVKTFRSRSRYSQLSAPLTPGCSLSLRRAPDGPVELELERTRSIDLVCPRAIATIHFGADDRVDTRDNWVGVAPEREAESEASAAE